MLKWLKRISLFFLVALIALIGFIRFQGIQYLAAYLGQGFAHALPAVNTSPQNCRSGAMTVLSYNVEYGSDFIESMALRFRHGDTGGALPWSTRLPEIRERIAEYDPDLIGFQETHTDTDIATIVPSTKYSLVSYHLGRFQYGDAALLFKTDRFELVDKGQFWLGPNPSLPMSYGFRALSMIRYVNWAMLHDKSNNFSFIFVNTHFDNASVNKEPSATLFYQQLTKLAQTLPVIVTGDFNTPASTERYDRLSGAKDLPPLLQNAYQLAGEPVVQPSLHPNQRIDHIFAGGACRATAESWLIDPRPLKNGQRMSDHDPLVSRLRFDSK